MSNDDIEELTTLSSHQLYVLHQRTLRALRNFIKNQLDEVGLSVTEWLIIGLVNHAESRGGLRSGDLAAELDVTPAFITQKIDVLSEGGYLKREVDKQDKRARLVRVTEKSKAVIAETERRNRRALARWQDKIEVEKLSAYLQVLRQMAEGKFTDEE